MHELYQDADTINARLTSELLRRHKIKSRPVSHPDDGLKVHVLSALYQIVDVVRANGRANHEESLLLILDHFRTNGAI